MIFFSHQKLVHSSLSLCSWNSSNIRFMWVLLSLCKPIRIKLLLLKRVYNLTQVLANLSCKWPDSINFRCCVPYGLCCNYSTLPETIHKWADMATFQKNNHKKHGGRLPVHSSAYKDVEVVTTSDKLNKLNKSTTLLRSTRAVRSQGKLVPPNWRDSQQKTGNYNLLELMPLREPGLW